MAPRQHDHGSAAHVHLVGGGPDSIGSARVLTPFAQEAGRARRAGGGRPRLLLVMADDAGSAEPFRPVYLEALSACADRGFDYLDVRLAAGHVLQPPALEQVDGIVVAGGPTPVYHRGLAPAAEALRAAVAGGVPYLGFSAGAMVAAEHALVGGWRDGGRAVCDEDWSEGLDELTVEPGLGLVGVTVDVHAAQGGLLGRAVSVAHRADRADVVAIDEATCLSVPLGWRLDGDRQVSGSGAVWLVRAGGGSALVRRLPA